MIVNTNNPNTVNRPSKNIYPWVVVGLLGIVALLNYLDRQMLSTMQKAMEIDITELQSAERFGFLMAIFLYIYGFMSPIAGTIADRVNRKWLIVGSLLVWSSVTYGMGLATTFNQLVWLRGLMGISEALYIPAALAMIADYHVGKTRSLAIGIHMTGLYLGQALGGFGATIADKITWHSTFHWFGIIGIAYAIILAIALKEKRNDTPTNEITQEKTHKEPWWRSLSILFSNIAFWVIIFYFAVPSLPGWATKNWLPTLFSENLNIKMSEAGPYATISIAASSFIGVLIGGIISDRWVQKNLRGRIYTSAIGLLLTIPGLIFIGLGHTSFAVIGATLCFGIGFGMFDTNNMPILCQFVSARHRATAYGLMNMVGVFAGAFVTDILGKSTDSGNLGKSFAMLGGVVLIAVIIQLIFLRPRTDNFTDQISVQK